MRRHTQVASLLSPLFLLGACMESNDAPGLLQPEDGLISAEDGYLSSARGSEGPVIAGITGSGHFEAVPPSLTLGSRKFAMTALRHANGSVEGTYTRVTQLDGGGVERGKGAVTCFTIIGNTAWVGGESEEGEEVAWQVVDNGQGQGAPPDQVGLQIPANAFGFPPGFAQEFCEETPTELDFGPTFGVLPLTVVLFDVEAGNIQIEVR